MMMYKNRIDNILTGFTYYRVYTEINEAWLDIMFFILYTLLKCIALWLIIIESSHPAISENSLVWVMGWQVIDLVRHIPYYFILVTYSILNSILN